MRGMFVTRMPYTVFVSLAGSERTLWMTIPFRDRPAVDGTVTSGRGGLPRSSRCRCAAARWLSAAPSPQASTAAM
ncbi:MAG: hypothetical protein QOJ89_2153 [bacterium]